MSASCTIPSPVAVGPRGLRRPDTYGVADHGGAVSLFERCKNHYKTTDGFRFHRNEAHQEPGQLVEALKAEGCLSLKLVIEDATAAMHLKGGLFAPQDVVSFFLHSSSKELLNLGHKNQEYRHSHNHGTALVLL
jgi:hypothetical protein